MSFTNVALAGAPAPVHSPAPAANPAPTTPSDPAVVAVAKQVLGSAAASTEAQRDRKSASSAASAAAPTHLDGAAAAAGAAAGRALGRGAVSAEDMMRVKIEDMALLGAQIEMETANPTAEYSPDVEGEAKLFNGEIGRLKPIIDGLYQKQSNPDSFILTDPKFWNFANPIPFEIFIESMCCEIIGHRIGRLITGVSKQEPFADPIRHAQIHHIKMLVAAQVQDISKFGQRCTREAPNSTIVFAKKYYVALLTRELILKFLLTADKYFSADEWKKFNECLKQGKKPKPNDFKKEFFPLIEVFVTFVTTSAKYNDHHLYWQGTDLTASWLFFKQAVANKAEKGSFGFLPYPVLNRVFGLREACLTRSET